MSKSNGSPTNGMSCVEGLMSCMQMHEQQSQIKVLYHEKESTATNSMKSLLSSLVNVAIDSLAENEEYIYFKTLLSETIVTEIRERVHQQIDEILKSNADMEKLKSSVIEKSSHIERLEQAICELQSVLRLKCAEVRTLTGDQDNCGNSSSAVDTVEEEANCCYIYPLDNQEKPKVGATAVSETTP